VTATGWLVGIDDTDNAESIGTGRLARMLAEHLESEELLAATSVTRHQFLVHPDIPYTSHNSSACIAGLSRNASRAALAEAARGFLREHFHDGANPGLCVCAAEAVPGALLALAERAQREVLRLEEFDRALAALDLELWWGGETGQGRIGASSGVALRSTGRDGRFIALRGIRELEGRLRTGEILARSAVDSVEGEDGTALASTELVDTRDWVRPVLRGGRAILQVRRDGRDWVPAERRSKQR
jgi:tRNA(Ile2) C34 agmatinyltransferase TiaS